MLSIRYNVNDLEAKTAISGLADRMSKPRQALKECGLALLRSIAKNFKEGGRPVRWKPSERAKKTGGKTLIDTARLRNSIAMSVTGKKLTVGTNVKYAGIQHFGGTINRTVAVREHYRVMRKAFGRSIPTRRVLVRAHTRDVNITIPARPFLLVQDSDWRMFRRIFEDYLLPMK